MTPLFFCILFCIRPLTLVPSALYVDRFSFGNYNDIVGIKCAGRLKPRKDGEKMVEAFVLPWMSFIHMFLAGDQVVNVSFFCAR